MKIGMNASRLAGPRLGVGRYLEYMLKYWSVALDADDEVYAYVRQPVASESIAHLSLSPAIKFANVNPALTGLLWENASMASRVGMPTQSRSQPWRR